MENIMVQQILPLLQAKREGPYWDFKKQWHDKKEKLLLDIIAMANNLADHDGYIFIGVDEENNYDIVDVLEDPNRRNTDGIVDFLRDKSFAGGIRPSVVVETLKLAEGTIDVIIIRNTTNTPYYLTKNYNSVREGNIYVRVESSNTPIDRTADADSVEQLWRKRLRVDEEPLQSVRRYLLQNENWINSSSAGALIQYYRFHPEYTITLEMDDRDGVEYYMLGTYVYRLKPEWWMVTIRYHQTVLGEVLMLGLDSSRCIVAAPDRELVHFNSEKWARIDYFRHDSIVYGVHQHYCDPSDMGVWTGYRNFMRCVLEFENQDELQMFCGYVKAHEDDYNKLMAKKDCDIPNANGLPDGYVKEAFIQQYKEALVVKQLYYMWAEDRIRT